MKPDVISITHRNVTINNTYSIHEPYKARKVLFNKAIKKRKVRKAINKLIDALYSAVTDTEVTNALNLKVGDNVKLLNFAKTFQYLSDCARKLSVSNNNGNKFICVPAIIMAEDMTLHLVPKYALRKVE